MSERSHKPRVSIGLPVYNGERYLAETLDSLLVQTFEDFEIIICDNASTDQTEQICRSYLDRDRRIRYFRNSTNVGAAKNYRSSFQRSVGEYFRWANCDDVFAAESLARCIEVLDREPSVALVYPKTKFIDQRGDVIAEYEDRLQLLSDKASERFIQLLQRIGYVNVIYGLIRANVLRRTGLIRNFIGGDIPLVAELALYGKFREVPEFLFYRRFHEEASSSYKDISQLQEFFDPGSRGRPPFRRWKHLGAHLLSVLRSPLSVCEKIRLGCYLARRGIWHRRKLAGELFEGLRRVIPSNFLGR